MRRHYCLFMWPRYLSLFTIPSTCSASTKQGELGFLSSLVFTINTTLFIGKKIKQILDKISNCTTIVGTDSKQLPHANIFGFSDFANCCVNYGCVLRFQQRGGADWLAWNGRWNVPQNLLDWFRAFPSGRIRRKLWEKAVGKRGTTRWGKSSAYPTIVLPSDPIDNSLGPRAGRRLWLAVAWRRRFTQLCHSQSGTRLKLFSFGGNIYSSNFITIIKLELLQNPLKFLQSWKCS